jgi:hypothetical protein
MKLKAKGLTFYLFLEGYFLGLFFDSGSIWLITLSYTASYPGG